MRLKDNFVKLKEYDKFYLYAYMENGKILYKECFMKADVDGVIAVPKERGLGNTSKYKHIWGDK